MDEQEKREQHDLQGKINRLERQKEERDDTEKVMLDFFLSLVISFAIFRTDFTSAGLFSLVVMVVIRFVRGLTKNKR